MCDRARGPQWNLEGSGCEQPPPQSSIMSDLVRDYGWTGPYCRSIGMDCLGDQQDAAYFFAPPDRARESVRRFAGTLRNMRALVLALVLLGCGAETNGPPSAGGDVGVDGDTAGDAADAAPRTWRSGKILEGGHYFYGVTSDDWLALGSSTMPVARAISLRVASESPLPAMMQTHVDGAAVFLWSSTSGPLQVWTAANGVRKLTEVGLTAGRGLAADAEGRRVAFVDGATGGNLTISSPTGSDRIDLGPAYDGCTSQLRFVGERLVATYCKTKGAYGVTVFDKAGNVVQSTVAQHFELSAKGDVLALQYGGAAHVLAAGASTFVKVAGAAQFAAITRDGSAVLYFDAARDLHRTPSSAAAPVKLAPNVATFKISPDGARVLVSSNSDGSDLAIASATAAGAIDPIATDSRLAAFTTDNRYVVYMSTTGALHARAITGGAVHSLGTGVSNFEVAEGSSVVAIGPSGELLLGDAADGTPLKTVASGVTQFMLTPDATHLAYVGPTLGVVVIPVR